MSALFTTQRKTLASLWTQHNQIAIGVWSLLHPVSFCRLLRNPDRISLPSRNYHVDPFWQPSWSGCLRNWRFPGLMRAISSTQKTFLAGFFLVTLLRHWNPKTLLWKHILAKGHVMSLLHKQSWTASWAHSSLHSGHRLSRPWWHCSVRFWCRPIPWRAISELAHCWSELHISSPLNSRLWPCSRGCSDC